MKRRLFTSREGALAGALVLACGLLLAFFACRTFVDPLPKQHRLDFGPARWIENAEPSASGYFRKIIYIAGNIDRAWVQVSATDRFFLYVNGVPVDENFFSNTRVSGIYDVKHLLGSGRNVIAIRSRRISYPGNCQILVRGFYSTESSPLTGFQSDATWKVSTTPDGVVGSHKWNDTVLDDALWANAHEAAMAERFSTIQPVDTDPLLLETRPSAAWLGARDLSALDATFEGKIQGSQKLYLSGSALLQVAATGAYDIVINGRLAISQDTPQMTELPFAQANASAAGPVSGGATDLLDIAKQAEAAAAAVQPLNLTVSNAVPTLTAYDISRWLQLGENTIRIHVRCENGVPAVLAEAVIHGATLQRFATGSGWQVRAQTPGADAGGAAVVLGQYGMRPWGLLPQAQSIQASQPPSAELQLFLKRAVTYLLGAILVVGLWLLSATCLGRAARWTPALAMRAGALAHVPVLALLLLLWLLSYDVRFASDWCFTPGFVGLGFGALLLSQLLIQLRLPPLFTMGAPLRGAGLWKLAAFTAVFLLGFWLRARDLNTMSLGSDEMTMIANADGVLASGYPHSPRGTYERLLATYELVPYALALSSVFFGHSEFAYHLPALIFGSLTVALMGFVGTRMIHWRAGFIGALIYACFPPALAWSRNAFYPAQEQFLSLCTFWLFYEAIRCAELRPRFLTLASLGFVLSYLSWEGSGFILPALFIAMLAMRWADRRWMADWHLWRCIIVISLIVVTQLSYRQLTVNDYKAVGYSLSDITSPQLVYSNPLVYNSTYYIKVLFFAEINFALSLFIFGGCLFCWRDRAIRYLIVLLFSLELFYTNFLPFYAPRYCYNSEVLVILAGVAIFFKLCDSIAGLGADGMPAGWPRALRFIGPALLAGVFVLATNEFVIKSYRLSSNAATPALFGRLGYYKTDHRGAAQFVAKRLETGDGVVAFMPHIFEFYSHKRADYSIDTFLNSKMNFDTGMERPQFIDKFRGRPLIRSTEEFLDVLSRYKRLWIVVPIHDENELMSPSMWALLGKRGRVAYESYREQVIVVEAAARQ